MKSSRYFCLLLPVFLFVGWVTYYYFWRSHPGSENLRPLFDTSKQWYIGRDGDADAKNDVRREQMKLFGGWSADGFGRYELSSYHEILRGRYSVEPVYLYYLDGKQDKYAVLYSNAYNAIIFEHLKSAHGGDIEERIKAEYQKIAELKVKAADILNQQQE